MPRSIQQKSYLIRFISISSGGESEYVGSGGNEGLDAMEGKYTWNVKIII